MSIIKRDGSVVPFLNEKITAAVCKAFSATGEIHITELNAVSMEISKEVVRQIQIYYSAPVDIEDVQNEVESALMRAGYEKTAKAYILYRAERERDKNSRLM